jgi:hypothetical protein
MRKRQSAQTRSDHRQQIEPTASRNPAVLDCLDGTSLLDLKPDRSLFMPIAPRQPGDDQVGDEN